MRVTQMPATGAPNKRRTDPPERINSLPPHQTGSIDIKKIFSQFEKDDYILAGLILVLVLEGCDDYILLAALGYLFIMGIKD